MYSERKIGNPQQDCSPEDQVLTYLYGYKLRTGFLSERIKHVAICNKKEI